MALLTPKDIREHTFRMVRFQEGYKIEEVDDFLDQVTQTVEALGRQAMQNAQSTQTLSPDVADLNAKLSDLSTQLQASQEENVALKARLQDSSNEDQHGAELEAQNQTLSAQNDQLKSEVDRLSAQVDQLTAQAAGAAEQDQVAQALAQTQQERDQLRAEHDNVRRELEQLREQLQASMHVADELTETKRLLEESRQREEQLRVQIAKVEPSTETGSLQKIAGAAAAASTEPERATAMLTLAMQLHDQYVDKGKAKAREITEASQQRYNELISQANDYSTRTRTEADAYSERVHSDADAYSQNTHSDADSYAKRTRSEADQYSDRTRSEADEYAAHTRQSADDYSAKTHQDAEDFAQTKRNEVDRYEQEVQHRAGEYDQQTRQAADTYAQQVRDNLEAQTRVVEGNIQGLKQFETEYRARLTDFLGQLVSQVSDSNNYADMQQPKQ